MYKVKETNKYKKISLLWGLVTLKTYYLDLSKELRICGLNLFKAKVKKNKLQWFFELKFPLFAINSDRKNATFLYEWVKSNYDGKFDSIYSFFGAPSGETYVVLNLLDKIFQKDEVKSPIVVVDKISKYNLLKFFKPSLNVLLFKKVEYLEFYKEYSFNIEGCRIFNFFPTEHYLKQDVLINKNREHYYSYITRILGLSDNNEFLVPDILPDVKTKIANFVNFNKLEKFVILFPEANTCDASDIDWTKISQLLLQAGYQVLLNTSVVSFVADGVIPIFLKYDELVELSKYAKALVGLRSGLIEILTVNKDVPFFVMYTGFLKRGHLQEMTSDKALCGFSLKRLPNVNVENIHEFDVAMIDEKSLVEEIVKE